MEVCSGGAGEVKSVEARRMRVKTMQKNLNQTDGENGSRRKRSRGQQSKEKRERGRAKESKRQKVIGSMMASSCMAPGQTNFSYYSDTHRHTHTFTHFSRELCTINIRSR